MEQAGKAVGLASGVVAGLRLPQEVVAAARSAFANYEQAARASSAERAEPPDTAPGPSALATAALFAEYVWSEGAAAVAAAIFEAFEETYCSGQNIHAQAHDAGIEGGQAEAVLRAYYAARDMYIRARGALAVPVPRQALFSTPQFRILAAFGGQGGMDNYIDEARTVFSIYRPLVVDFVLRMSDFLKREAAEPQFARHYPHGLDAMRWILSPEDTPAQEYMVTVPVCIPLVGLVQLMHVVVLYKSLVISPAELADRFQWITGHSQGLAVAATLALATTEDSFHSISRKALGLLMLTGIYPQMDYPPAGLSTPPDTAQEDGAPTPMAVVLKLTRAQLASAVDRHNAYQPTVAMRIHLSLTNGDKIFVVSGATSSLTRFVASLKREFDTGGADQTRIPFSKRKPGVAVKYLSINAPYHCELLAPAAKGACEYATRRGWLLDGRCLRRPLKATDDGRDVRGVRKLSHFLLRSMIELRVDWPAAVTCPGVTHVVDFGPGGVNGIGVLVHRIYEGRGVSVICAGAFESRNSPLAAKTDLYRRDATALLRAPNWADEFRPRLIRCAADGRLHIDTPMSRLLGKPPVMVAGMTPSTISDVFVSAVVRAGYHIELSGGGHFSEPMLRDKVDKILKQAGPGTGITINSIYVNPFLWNIQYPAMQTMRREGIPMEGLCIGAGVPSFEVCNEIIASIREVGFRHIGLKPSSVSTIRLVIKIAQANADFPILLQWTGGRGGGHHSFEDFHQPILETYSAIRAQKNIVLVAGSGFGGVDDTLPYLTGDWSRRFDRAPMPFDGCLFGSRVMVAKEGAASDSVKEAIVAAQGVDDSEWEKTYSGPAGGIVTVLSELGEPIHKIATRGVMLWKELDDTVFSLPRDKRLPALLAKKDYIIKRLNDDFQKPWFGKKADGTHADLEEMTYAEVANRLLEVLYVTHQARWIDMTMRNLVGDYLLRLEERFAGSEGPAMLQSFDQLNEPFKQVEAVVDAYPESRTQLLAAEDVQFFINLCMRPGQKPVPFIPLMDKDFHIWFKKDSLWQSEDVDAVAGQDVGRVCILQGPVSVRYATKANEPVKDILDNIYHGQIAALLARYYGGDESTVPAQGYLGDVPAPRAVPPHVRVESTETERVYMLPKTKAQLPGDEAWLETLAGSELGWLRALLMAPVVVQGYKYVSNAARRVLRPRAGQILRVALEDGQPQAVEVINGSGAKALDIAIDSADSTIRFNMYSAPRGRECRLELLFRHQAAMPYAPIHEVMEGRNERIKRFYAQVWFDNSREAEDIIAQAGHGGQLHIGRATSVDRSAIKDFCYAIGHVSDKYTAAGNVPTVAPLDFAIRAFWPALCKCLMSPVCDGDLTSLVHLSNEFRVVPGAPPMGPDQQLSSEAEIVEVTDSASGRTVRVKGHVTRAGEPIVAIDTSFFFRGQAADYSRNFRHVHEQPLELEISDMSLLALLRSREWFVPVPGMEPLIAVGTTLHFALESRYNFKSATVHAYATTCGAVLACSPSSGRIKVADVDFESADSYGSLVMRFLHKHGRPVGDRRQLFSDVRNLVTAGKRRMAVVQVPDNNQAYSDASTDHNPIHTNEYFADLVALPATIAHGMWTSAAARKCLQNVVADGQPERVVAYGTTFVDMVLPGKQLETRIHHSGFVNGRMLVDVEAYVDDTKVLAGTAEVEQAPTAFAFTGQGAHAPGMGMGLYASSRVARGVWDSADTFMRDTYGIPLLDIVQSNPTSHTVHFVGPRGARIRDNYRSMVYEYSASDGSRLITRPLFVDITETTESFTFYSPRGLLYATQFTQAAMLICEVAEFSHIYTSGVVPETAVYAGHSLGEYAGLTAIGQVFTPETAADIGFCRGLTMQQSVRRDAQGQSIYAMVAVSTARVALWFTPDDLERVVAAIKQHGDYDGLLEVVNYNVRNMQYVVSGELVLLEALGQMLSALGVEDGLPDGLAPLARSAVKAALSRRSQDAHFELQRTKATIPIPGIDVPFHSSLLHAGVWSFRKMLQSKIKPQQVSISRLCGRYIPNLTARPFDIGREYLEAVLALTGSAPLVQLLDTYDAERVACDPVYAQHVAYVLLIEVLSHQFSSPVRWIETQDVLLAGNLAVARFIEIGPSGVLCNMLRRTLDGAVYAPGGPEILCSATDMDRILFQDADVQPDKADAAPALAEPAGSSGAQALPEALQAEPDAPGAAEPSCAAREVPEAATPPLEVIRALVAYKLKIVLESVTAATAIKDLVGGKSTLQNEIVGDLQKEFGGDFPDKPEELPLAELAQSLALADGALGRVSTGLIARMLTSKMPGGYTKSSVCQHLQSAFGLGQQRQQALLLVALTMEPAARLDSEASAKDWLATAAKAYAKLAGISLSSTPAPGARRAAGSAGPVAVINSAEFTAAQKAQRQLAKRTMHALAAYLGLNIDPATDAASDSDKGGPATAPPAASAAASDLDIWAAEYGQDYCDAIRPAFSSQMVRQYDSYWNWARQDLIELYYAIIEGRITKMDLSMSSHCLRLMNRVTSSLVDVLKHIVSCSQQSSAPAQLLARKYGAGLIKQCTLGMGAAPAYQFTERHLAPRLRVNASGEHEYFEVDRPGEKSVRDYVDAVFSLGDFAKPASDIAGEALGAVLEGLGLPRAGPGKRSVRAPPPMVHLRSWAAGAACWSYDAAKSARLRAILDDICENGLSLAGRRALVTGCGRGSIGAEVLKGLLESGAQVVATTSSYSPSTTRYFQEMYQRHGSRGSSLVLLPFNQASRQDVSQLVEYIYADSSRGKGLGWDLDYVLPFAAIPELGHDITDLGPRSELAHRAMLTNVLRLLGEVASQKAKRRLDMHPTLAILPLSPNHGIFGSDGHYAESKIGLETLLHRWHSEPAWSPYVSVAGAAIGWTRGTGLMSGNNLVAECVERVGVRTFTAPEMAFNILGLLHPRAYAMAAQEPVWADMSGRFQCYPEVAGTIAALRRALAEMRSIVKVTTDDFHADFSTNADEETERVYRLRTIDPRANHRLRLPEVKRYEQLAHLRHLQGMVNLDQVVVVAGYGEVGPYGSAETRWEMEAHGEFSLEGCIELAWIMGYIKHFNGKHRKTGKVYTGWVDAQTEEPVADRHIKQRYERLVLEHTGIRLVEPEGMDGYDPSKKSLLRELQIEHDMEPFDATEEEARQFKLRNGDRVRIWENKAAGGGQWLVRLLKGATLMVPKALRFDRLVAAQVPAGWDPVRYGIPKSIADQLDRVTWYALVATTEALVRAGITDPYEMYRYVHVSEVGSSAGTALGGMNSTRRVYFERHCDRDQRPDVYQESFLTTPSAWVNMLLLSAAGPIKTTIGACASGVASIDVAVDTILSGKAKVMLAGSSDTIGEESAFEFAQMNATSNTLSEFQQGRAPSEMSRPCTSTRSGFMESEGSGIAVLMLAAIAIEMGAPIHGILAMTGTATDKEGRSVPAPGKGVLTSAREAVPSQARIQALDIGYRRRQLELQLKQIREWAAQERKLALQDAQAASRAQPAAHPAARASQERASVPKEQLGFIDAEAKRQSDAALDLWGNSFWKRNPHISPLRGALAVWGLTVDDIGVASMHGTSTKANDTNESEIIERQLRHLGRTPGNVVFAVCQKYLTGHPKGPAAMWMLNGVMQTLRTGIVPGNRNADNIAAELESCEYIVYPSRSIQTPGIKAALLKSFGFGQVGAECLVVHPDYLLAVLSREQLDEYRSKAAKREAHVYRYWHNVLTGAHPLVQIKDAPPYTADMEEQVYLDPVGRIGRE